MDKRIYAGLTPRNVPTEDTIPDDVWGHGTTQRWWTPNWDEDDKPALPERSFIDQIDRLPKAMGVPVYWQHPLTGEHIPTARFNAVVDPEKAERVSFGTKEHAQNELGDDFEAFDGILGDEALHFVPTGEYTVINPRDFLGPLADAIDEAGLGDDVFGEFRVFGTGGKVSADVFFRGLSVEYAGASEGLPIVLGIQIDWDHNGGTSVQAQGMGMDGNCSNSIRGITDEMLVKHAGDVESRVDWKEKWDHMLETIGLKADQLAMMIREAQARTVDLRELPDDFADGYETILEAFYAHMGFPGYIATHASRNARAEADDPFQPDWWTLHSGATYAITHFTRADVAAGSKIEEHNRLANDMAFNPGRAYEQVIEGYRMARDEAESEGQKAGVAQIRKLGSDLLNEKAQFEERENTIRRLQEEMEA